MNIEQCEIWMVSFEPSIGKEIQKLRPALVVNDNSMGRFGLRTVIPITEWKDYFSEYPWIIKIEKSKQNGLKKLSSLECFQIKNFSQERFVNKIGKINKEDMLKVHETILKTFNPRYTIK